MSPPLRRLRKALPLVATILIFALAAILPVVIFLTRFSIEWVAFLVGIVVAASLALASRESRSRWLIARRDSQLRALRARLALETAARLRAQEALAASVASPRAAASPVGATLAVAPPLPVDAAAPAAPRAEAVELSASGVAGGDVRSRIVSALGQDDFSLYLQDMVRISEGSAAPAFHEVLLRLDEEEDHHLPPGTFLALAEECGMLPALDAWQVRAVVEWLGADPARRMETCGISVSADTLADPAFVGFVRASLREHKVGGGSLCLEIGADELGGHLHRMLPGIGELRREGCRFALTGFGRGPATLRLVRELGPDYVKIDGGIVVGSVRSPAQAARLNAVNRIAHACGAATIAECVESAEIRACLADCGVDFAQGSAIAAPYPLRGGILGVPWPRAA